MGFFEKLVKNKRQVSTQAAIYQERAGTLTAWQGSAYANDVYRSGVDAIARTAGKLKVAHVISGEGENKQGNTQLNRLLQVRPNPLMTAYDMLYKVATHLFLNNNAFIYIHRDDRGTVKGLYPVDCSAAHYLLSSGGGHYIEFTAKDNKKYTLPYSDVVHLRRFYNDNLVFGASNAAIAPGLELAHTQNEGIISGIKSGATIRGLLKFTSIMAADKMKAAKDKFVADYLELNNSGGIVATDATIDYTPLESKPIMLSAEQAAEIKTKIYNYLGITENIVKSSFTEDEFNAFYESIIEPLCMALSQELTAKIFTEREQAYGNYINVESGRLQFTSQKTKINLISQIMPLGLLTVNQALEILNLPAVEDGDKRLQALNMINADKAEAYQIGETEEMNT